MIATIATIATGPQDDEAYPYTGPIGMSAPSHCADALIRTLDARDDVLV